MMVDISSLTCGLRAYAKPSWGPLNHLRSLRKIEAAWQNSEATMDGTMTELRVLVQPICATSVEGVNWYELADDARNSWRGLSLHFCPQGTRYRFGVVYPFLPRSCGAQMPPVAAVMKSV